MHQHDLCDNSSLVFLSLLLLLLLLFLLDNKTISYPDIYIYIYVCVCVCVCMCGGDMLNVNSSFKAEVYFPCLETEHFI